MNTCMVSRNRLPSAPTPCVCRTGRDIISSFYEERLGGHYLVTVTPLFNAQGEVTGSVHTAKDITESKRAEEALKDTNAKLQALINTIPDMVIFKDVVGRHVVVNRAVEEVTGHAGTRSREKPSRSCCLLVLPRLAGRATKRR